LDAGDVIYPQFATHNAHSVAAIEHMAVLCAPALFEFQRLHGMGDALYHSMSLSRPVRVYAPVGAIPKPKNIFPDRENSNGLDLSQLSVQARLLNLAENYKPRKAASLVFITLLSKEAGKCLGDNIAEIREAIDFCRFYAAQAATEFGTPEILPGPAGETNTLTLSGRGTFICISPWNFPLAIFIGQVVAALAAGNSVIAKPAEQTPLIAHRAAELLYKAGVPKDVFQLTLGAGELGSALVEAPMVAGVCFTGSTEVAKKINMALAAKDGPIPILIAETGGLNGMFVDTTALKEQVMDDVTCPLRCRLSTSASCQRAQKTAPISRQP